MNSYCYHVRDTKGVKLVGGMLHAENMQQAAERATAGYTVKLRAGFGSHFVDKEGREVSLYLSIHPEYTERGAQQIAAARAEREAKRRQEAEETERIEEELSNAIDELGGTAGAIKALRAAQESKRTA